MGAIHRGHISLARAARAECATVVASIFVNPTQFGATEDLNEYPRPLADDLQKLAAADVDVAFTPTAAEMYPDGFAVQVRVGGPALPLEGAARPGHFDGVATVVAKLLIQSDPDRAYFGLKDGQQVAVVKRVARDLDIATEIVALPTVREPDGLAVSSRNKFLRPPQRAAAAAIYRALAAARAAYAHGLRDPGEILAGCRQPIESETLIDAIDYVAVVDPSTMESWPGHGECMLAVAVRLGDVRLIDNVILEGDHDLL